MENAQEYYTMENLQKCSYRDLQKITKSMCLPSNVKKMYLIQMIYAKKFCSAQEVENLVRTIRQERQNLSIDRKSGKTKKQTQPITEVSFTSQNKSPSITPTPKRTRHIMIRYSPDQYSPPKSRACRSISFRNSTTKASDRVLRSFGSSRNSNHIDSTLIGRKSSSSEENINSISEISVSTINRSQQVNMPTLLRKKSLGWRSCNEIVPLRKGKVNISSQPVKRQRKLSGIYPLDKEPKTATVSVRRADGTLSKLKTYIQKPFTRNRSERREHIAPDIDIITGNIPISTTNLITATITNITTTSTSENTLSCENNEDTSGAMRDIDIITGNIPISTTNLITATITDITTMSTSENTLSCENNEDTSGAMPDIDIITGNIPISTTNLITATITNITTMSTSENTLSCENNEDTSGAMPDIDIITGNIPISTTNLITATITNITTMSTSENTLSCENNEDTSGAMPDIDIITGNIPISTTNLITATITNITTMSTSENTLSCENNEDTSDTSKENEETTSTVYYHNKTRTEQVRCQVTKECARSTSNECRLPSINHVFSNFNAVYERDVTGPIYLNTEVETIRNQYPLVQNYQTNTLENLYNLKNQHLSFILNQPLYQVATTTNTYCVYSTPIITTPKAEPPANMCNYFNVASSQDNLHNTEEIPRVDNSHYGVEDRRLPDFYRNFRSDEASQDNSHYGVEDPRADNSHFRSDEASQDNSCYGVEDPRVDNFFRNFRGDEALSDETTIDARRSSSVEAAGQDVGAIVTIPDDMVEDVLEIISQDGDYMERMGMEKMQCVLCDWSGPRIILEYHIRREHETDIFQFCNVSGECVLLYSLGALVGRGAWVNFVLESGQVLFILSAKYQDPDRFTAILTTLSSEDTKITGSITTLNKVTGEPYTWQGTVEQLPHTMAYEDDHEGLKLELSKVNVLPNSANAKLVNRELVTKSPNKVVVGQPELDSIKISLIVKLHNEVIQF